MSVRKTCYRDVYTTDIITKVPLKYKLRITNYTINTISRKNSSSTNYATLLGPWYQLKLEGIQARSLHERPDKAVVELLKHTSGQ